MIKNQRINILVPQATGSLWQRLNFATILQKQADDMETNEQGCVPIKVDLWTLRFELHVTFTCHNSIRLGFPPNHLKM